MNCDQESLQRYIKDAAKYPLLTPQRERELSDIIQKGTDHILCLNARNELITGNLLLVINIAVKIYKRFGSLKYSDLSVMDLIQFGNMALIRCANGFKSEKGVKFNTYAYSAIERDIYIGINEHRFIRLPQEHEIMARKISELEIKHGKKLTDEMIMSALKINTNMLKNIRKNQNLRPVAIDDWEVFLDHVQNKHEKPITQDIEEKELKDSLLEKMHELKPKELKTVYLMFFDDSNTSMADVAKKMGVTRERIRVILRVALRKLKVKILQGRAEETLGLDKKAKKENKEKKEKEERKRKETIKEFRKKHKNNLYSNLSVMHKLKKLIKEGTNYEYT